MARAEEHKIRKYLLGQLPEAEEEQVELRLLTEPDFAEEYDIVVNELTDDYIAGKFEGEELKQVEEHFFKSSDRRNKLKFAVALKKRKAELDADKGKKNWFSPYLAIAAAVALLAGGGFYIWRALSNDSDLNKGLAALQSAFRNERPLEARLSDFSYAPVANQRGGPAKIDYVQRDLAASLLLKAVSEHPSAESHRALGLYYLAQHEFDKAIDQFQAALALDPKNAKTHGDLGAALMERGRAESSGPDKGKAIEDFAKSLEHLNKALELDGSLLEANFNLALLYQDMILPKQAEKAWREYLQRDSKTPWADEARRNLKALEGQQQGRTSQSNEQVLQNIVRAYKSGDAENAWEIISQNREAITGKLVWERLVNAYLDRAVRGQTNEAGEMLLALRFVAEVDHERSGDNYATEIARFYELLPPNGISDLLQAQQFLTEGFSSCLNSRFAEALVDFEKAGELFKRERNEPETKSIDYWLSYCYYQLTRTKKSLSLLGSLTVACQKKQYKWLLSQTLSLVATVHTAFNEYSKGIDDTKMALRLSEQISDNYGVQKNLAQLANQERSLGSYRQSLTYMHRCLELAEASWPGPRQMWRNYDTTGRVFYSLGLFAAAAAYSREALYLALNEIKDPSMIYVSQVHLGLTYGHLKDYEQGIKHAQLGLEIGQSLSSNPVGQKIVAYSSLQLGYLYRQGGELEEALLHYDKAIQIYDSLAFEVFAYDAHKGRLLCYTGKGENESAKREVQIVLGLFEKYRSQILEESDRNNFFDVEQSVYDLAIDFEFSKDGNQQAALEYSEISRARSLLDLLGSETRFSNNSDQPRIVFASVSQPLKFAEIQAQMSDQAQIIQYSVLKDRLIIWVISRASFSAHSREISLSELTERVREYRRLVSNVSSVADTDRQSAAVSLYDILIKPIEELLVHDKQLCIVPDKILNQLPFGTLVSSTAGRYLIEDFSILYSPSSSIFVATSGRARQKSGANERLLAVGNPNFDRQAFPSLPDLPTAERETDEICRLYASKRCLVGDGATKEQVLREMTQSDVVHLAAHYVLDEKEPLHSKLLLAKNDAPQGPQRSSTETLEAQDIYRLKSLPTRLVVLSACMTSAEGYYNGEGAIGFSRAFLATGIPMVIASQWPVDSSATEVLMVNFHKYRRLSGLSSVDALRRAQVEMLHGSDGGYQRPYYWAPFIAIGGYAAF